MSTKVYSKKENCSSRYHDLDCHDMIVQQKNDNNNNNNSRRRVLKEGISGLSILYSSMFPRSALASFNEPQSIAIPLLYTGSEYLISYRIDSKLFRAVLDTGSPFLMIPGSCGENTRRKSGCYEQEGVPSGLSSTFEQFDGFEGEVEWRRAPFSFYNATGSMIVSSPTIVFGVADEGILGGTGGVFFGLIKETDSWIRPSFLGQTDVTSFQIDLRTKIGSENLENNMATVSPSLTLSTVPQLSSLTDYIPITRDLRRYGDPVQHYVSKVKSICINGIPLIPSDKRPIYAIFDTGVTGMVLSRELYDQRYLEARTRREKKLWGGEVEVTFETAQNKIKSIVGMKPLTTPFNPRKSWKKFKGHVIVLGLSFLNGRNLVVDIDDRRILLED